MSKPNSRDPEKDPAAALGKTLKRLREAAGLTTYAAAGARVGYGEDSIRKGESGWQVPTREAILKLLDAYKCPELMRPAVLDMWALARKSKGPIPEFIQKFIEAEAEAEFLWLWAPDIVPGQFQVEEYAMEIFRLFGKGEDEAAEETTARMDRQAIQNGPNPVHITAVIHESLLRRRVGTPAIMVKQLRRLLEASERPNVIIQVVPDDEYFAGLESCFEIAIGDAITDTMVTVAVEDYVDERRDVVRKAIALFQEIRARALPAEDSRAVIREALPKWETQQRTQAGASPATAAMGEPAA